MEKEHGMSPEAVGVEAQVEELAKQNGITLDAKDRLHYQNRFRRLVQEKGHDEAQHEIDLEMEAAKEKKAA